MPPKNSKKNRNKNNDAGQVKEEDNATTVEDQTKPEEQATQVQETKPEEQKAPETSSTNNVGDLSDSVVLVNSSIKSDTVNSPKKEEIPTTTHQEVKSETVEHVPETATKVEASPQKVEAQPVQQKAPEEHKAEPQPEVKHEEPKKVESKPQDVVVPEVEKEEPKPVEVKPETPKKEEPKKEEPKPEVKKEEPKVPEVKHEEKKPEPEVVKVEAKTEKVEASTESKTQSAAVNESGKKVGAVQSPEKHVVAESPAPKTQSPLNLDGSIGKNYEVISRPQDDDDSRSDVAQAPSESRLLDDLSAPTVSQRSSLETQPFVISREPSTQGATFAEKSAQAEKLAAEATAHQDSKDYTEAIKKFKSAIDLLDPASLDKTETEPSTKKVFEYTLKISENYLYAKDLDQALNFSQIVQHADPANLQAAWLISQVQIQKGEEKQALETLTKALNKYGKRTDQPEQQKKAADEQAKLDAKLNPKQEKAPEPTPVKKEVEQKKVENKNTTEEQGSNKDLGYTAAITIVGGVVGFSAAHLLKLPTGQKTLVSALIAFVSGAIAYTKGGDDQKKEK